MAPSRVVGGGLAQSSPSSGLYFQGDGQSQGVISSHFSSSFGNSTNLLPGRGRVSGDPSNTFFNGVTNSGPSVGASSLVTDANSGISGGGPHLQRSTSINADSYMRLPASPMSFSSNNISISGSSVIDGSSVVQQDQSSQVLHGQQQNGASSATSFPAASTMGQISLPMSSSFIPEPNTMFQVNKKPRLDIKQEDILRQQVIHQLLQKPESLQLQSHNNPQVQALLQQERLRQQQLLQSMPQMQRAQLQQQQQQLQLRQQMQQQNMQQPLSSLKRPSEGGVCSRRLMQYLYHQRQRPSENTIAYWRKFVAEYYSPRAKKRWCLSSYDNVGQHALGVFPQAAMDAWQCDICGSKSGRGFEATFEVLPRLNEIKFGSDVIDELLFMDFPHECRFPSGIMMLEYGKAVQETIYEQLRVVREGHLRIIFTHDLKILSWEFCVRRHEELLPRKLVAPQVNQLVQVAQKYQNTISEGGAAGVSQQDLQANSNMVLTAGRQLARSLELQSLNDLGFSKRYVRCLQISEVVNSMKDLIDFCSKHKAGPIDGLKNYPRHASAAKLQMQKMQEVEQLSSVQQGLPTDRNTLNKLMSMNNNHPIINRGPLNGSAQAALALSNYQNLRRQNSMNSNANSPQQEPSSSSFNNTNPNPSPRHSGSLLQAQPSQSNQVLQQHMIQQLLMSKNNGPGIQQQQSFSGHNSKAAIASANVSGGVLSHAPSRSNSFKATSNSESSAANGNFGSNQKAVDLPQNRHVPDDIVQDIAREFTGDDDFFNSDFDDNIGFGWKA